MPAWTTVGDEFVRVIFYGNVVSVRFAKETVYL